MYQLSFILPSFNEEENIRQAYTELKRVINQLPADAYSFEIIFTDNDSTDNTQTIIREICAHDNTAKAIFNRRNYRGRSLINAMCAATGDAVLWFTSDLQDPYTLALDFVREWENGEKVVWGQKTRSEEPASMYILRTIYYRLINGLSEVQQYQHTIGLGLYDRSVVEEIKTIHDPNLDLRNVIPELGYKPRLIPYVQQKRQRGKTKSNFFYLFNFALNAMVHTTKVPMRLMVYLGMVASLLSLFLGLFYLILKLFFWERFSAGIMPIFLVFCFISSVQLFFLGIMGEYILAILDRTDYPKNTVHEKERINF
ncbi:MAG: glycosyltransferase family 2 protein [Bacteriovoracaceae bacterium]|nr:glycosyltransferase family 2 protein [Bacteriovoracaceae bacterium]